MPDNDKQNAKTVSFAPLSSSSPRPRSSTLSSSAPFSSCSLSSFDSPVPRAIARLPKHWSFHGLTDGQRQRQLPREDDRNHHRHHCQGGDSGTVQGMDGTAGARAEPSCSTTSAAVPDGRDPVPTGAGAAVGSTAGPGVDATTTTTSQPAHLGQQDGQPPQQPQQLPIEEQVSSTAGLAEPDAAAALVPPPPHLRSYLYPPGGSGMFAGGHQPFMAGGGLGQQPMYFHPPPTMPNGNMMMMPMPQMPPLGMGSGGGGGAPYLLHNPPIMGPSIPAPPGAMMSPLSSSSPPSQISPFFANGQGSLLNPPAYITGGGHGHAGQPHQYWANPYYQQQQQQPQQQPFLVYPQAQQGQQQMYYPPTQVHLPGSTAATVTLICAPGQPGPPMGAAAQPQYQQHWPGYW